MAAEWKPGQLADWELTRKRAGLESRIRTFAPGSARAVVLHRELTAVIAEQEERKKVRAGPLGAALRQCASGRAMRRCVVCMAGVLAGR